MAYPSSLVLETRSTDAAVENSFYLPLGLTIYNCWRLIWFHLAGERRSSKAQSISMKDVTVVLVT